MPVFEGKLRHYYAPETMALKAESGAKLQGKAFDNVLVVFVDLCTDHSLPGDKKAPEVGQRVRVRISVEPDDAEKDPVNEKAN